MFRKALNILCLIIWILPVYSQNTITGLVSDTSSNPINNVYIEVESQNTITDENGSFSLDLANGIHQILFSHLTFQDTVLNVPINGNTVLQVTLIPSIVNLEAIEVVHHWADQNTPMTYQNMHAEEWAPKNLGQDLPYLLRRTPSMVITSDAGNGIGYTGMRIRGSDPTRINVTINGVPLNDSESQGVFWVDLPDFGSSSGSIQIQRGVGSSTNGSGAFGGSVNLNTQVLNKDPFGSISVGLGSFNSQKYNLKLGTGIIKDRFSVEGRVSRIISDGYIDRASSDLTSFYLSGLILNAGSSIRLNVFSGHEITYQAWNGVPVQFIQDRNLRRTNTAGTERSGSPHPNEVDDYRQTHYQFILNQDLTNNSKLQATLFYTKGKGFFEQYKSTQDLNSYNISCSESTISDLIRRRWLDNDFYGILASYQLNGSLIDWTLGVHANQYLGQHFGEVIWTEEFCSDELDFRYYDNDATKNELSTYSKWNYYFNKTSNMYLDLQYRFVDYSFLGINNDGNPLKQQVSHHFFNPKIGLSYTPDPGKKIYASVAVAHREPNRNDYTEGLPGAWPKPERLINSELGWEHSGKNWAIGINGYYMDYKDQLVLTGQLNDVGAYIRANVDRSYRLGLEAQFDYQPWTKLTLNTSLTASHNKVKYFQEFIDDWDDGTQQIVEHQNTNLAFSPSWVGHTALTYTFWGQQQADNFGCLILESSWVSRQYLDNTSNISASIPAYWIHDATLQFRLSPGTIGPVDLFFQANNIFDILYSTNGWVYRFKSEGYDPVPDDPSAKNENNGFYHLSGIYTQATRHFMTGVTFNF